MRVTLQQAATLPTPWCFESKDQWHTWIALAYAARSQTKKNRKPGDPELFDACPCRDCTPEYQAKMIRKGDCDRPDYDTTKGD